MLEHMMEVAFMRDSDAYSNEREVERLKKAVADLEKKTSLAEKGINAFNAQGNSVPISDSTPQGGYRPIR